MIATAYALPGASPALLVEDHGGVRGAMRRMLEGLGWSVGGEAETMSQAASLVDDATRDGRRFSMAMLDYHLPDGTSIPLIERLKAVGTFVLIVTADTDPKAHDLSMEAGADMFVRKPVKMDVLRQVADAIEQSRRKSCAPG